MVERLVREPILVTAALEAVIGAGVAFGLGWSGEQVGALMIAFSAVLLLVRQLVTPVSDPRIDGY